MTALGTRRRGRHAAAALLDLEPVAAPAGTPTPQRTDGRILLGELLVRHEVLSAESVDRGLALQGTSGARLGAVLVELGVLSDRLLAEALAEQLGLPLAELGEQIPQQAALSLMAASVAREHMIVPLSLEGDVLHIAVAEPTPDIQRIAQTLTGRQVAVSIAPRSDVLHALNRSYRALGDIEVQVAAFTKSLKGRPAAQVFETGVERDSPVVTIVERILTQALRDRASDVHIEPQDSAIRIRFRIDGALHDALTKRASPSSNS